MRYCVSQLRKHYVVYHRSQWDTEYHNYVSIRQSTIILNDCSSQLCGHYKNTVWSHSRKLNLYTVFNAYLIACWFGAIYPTWTPIKSKIFRHFFRNCHAGPDIYRLLTFHVPISCPLSLAYIVYPKNVLQPEAPRNILQQHSPFTVTSW
jgi:hypothetical protein